MSTERLPEVWLRGTVAGISMELQPVAHALLQAQEEINDLIIDLPDELLWAKPSGLATPAFHLQHITGVIDRMITYADNRSLDEDQLSYLEGEGKFDHKITASMLLHAFNNRTDKAIKELEHINISNLWDNRPVGRKQLPSMVGGLLFHMAEHTMRHTGQLLVTVKVLRDRV